MSTPTRAGDRQLTCADCGAAFLWTASEQEFYRERGYEQPKRCPSCRRANKARRGERGQGGSR
jgi:hypothetical protein